MSACLDFCKWPDAGRNLPGSRQLISWIADWASRLLLLGVLAFIFGAETSYAESPQTSFSGPQILFSGPKISHVDALAYCRGDVHRPAALREDKRVLCFDGLIDNPVDSRNAFLLAQDGVFVVRSAGGDLRTIIELANILLDKRATVIVNDYCLANCASYLFFASVATFVPKDSLVAWRNVIESGECAGFSETSDQGAPHFGSGPCPAQFRDGRRNNEVEQVKHKFYESRVRIQPPPESIAVRRILKRKFDETGRYPDDVSWTWNPRFYSMYRTKVIYEGYPQSQDEVDAIAARVGLKERIIFDP
jgi:hypothetical protein